MRVLFLVALLGGCHKLFDLEPVTLGAASDGGSDGTPDDNAALADAPTPLCPITPAQFDEDGDGRDDRCDGCPTIVSNENDGDGDGLPTACDPNLSPSGDRILFYATFADAIDLTAFTTNGVAQWSANDQGTVSLANAARLRTTLDYTPTMIDVRTDGMTATSLDARLTIGNTAAACSLQASDCALTRNDAVCLRFANGESSDNAFVTSLTRMTLSRTNQTTTCEAFTTTQLMLTSTTEIGTANVSIETNDDAQVLIRSIVVYGAIP